VTAISFDERSAEPIQVFVELSESRAFRAYEPIAEDILPVTPDSDDLAIAMTYLEATRGLTERAGPEME
jgi:hypothetical protein